MTELITREITDAEMTAAQRSLEAGIEKFGATALRVRAERDQAIYVIDTLIANMKQQIARTTIVEGNHAAGELATAISQWIDYARDQRSRLP